jgi:hypothetical protein
MCTALFLLNWDAYIICRMTPEERSLAEADGTQCKVQQIMKDPDHAWLGWAVGLGFLLSRISCVVALLSDSLCGTGEMREKR